MTRARMLAQGGVEAMKLKILAIIIVLILIIYGKHLVDTGFGAHISTDQLDLLVGRR